jgi:hypothetical protein
MARHLSGKLTSSPLRRAAVTALFSLALVAAPHVASAQSEEELAGARAAATQGLDAFNAGNYEKALDMMGRAQALVHSPIHLYYMAKSYEKLNQLVKARENYLKVVREKLGTDASPSLRKVQQDAKAELAALDPRIPVLTVTVTGEGAAGARAVMNGKDIPQPLIGVARPVDPGEHKLQAIADGYESEVVTVTLAEGAKQEVVLELKPSARRASPAADEPASDSSAAVELTTPGPDMGAKPGSSGLRTASYVSFGVGVVGLGAGTWFLLDRMGKKSDIDSICSGGCPEDRRSEIQSLEDDAASAGTLAVVGYSLGAVGIGAGIALYVMSADAPASTGLVVRPYVGFNSAGVVGRF